MSYLRTVVLFGFVSRQTVGLFVVSVVLGLSLLWQVRQEQIQREECVGHHAAIATAGVAQRVVWRNPAPEIGFRPCFVDGELSPLSEASDLCWFFSSVACVFSFLIDAFWGLRTRMRWGETGGGMGKAGSWLRTVVLFKFVSRRTIVWLLLLLSFTAALGVYVYREDKPCREWKAAHPGRDPRGETSRETGEPLAVSFNPCTFWSSPPAGQQPCALGWLISFVGFCGSLGGDVIRFGKVRRDGRKVKATTDSLRE